MIDSNSELDFKGRITIEPAQIGDLPAIVAIDAEITGIEKPEVWYGYYAPVGSRDKHNLMVARCAGEVVGYTVGEIRAWDFGRPPCGWLLTINVRKDMRLAGIGTLLFKALQQDFQRRGVSMIRTIVHVDEHLLISFFRSHGMTAAPFIELEMKVASFENDTRP
jgi:GNAT superfamily N-acetyltransferase